MNKTKKLSNTPKQAATINKDYVLPSSDQLAIPYVKGKMLKTGIDLPNKFIRNRLLLVYPEYQFDELILAEDVDGYMRRAIGRKTAIMVNKGWSIQGDDPKQVEYVRRRMADIGYKQDKSFSMLIQELCQDYLRYSNALLVKQRSATAALPGQIRYTYIDGRKTTLEPVAAYFRMDPRFVRPLLDPKDARKQSGWRYYLPNNTYLVFGMHDVVHFYFDKRPGNLMGTPTNLPAIDDIRALRRLEENLELLVYQHLFPLFTVTVGDKDSGGPVLYEDGSSEIDTVVEQVQRMAAEGGWVMPYRWKMDVLDIKKLLPIETYIAHFKSRIYTSLGVSGIDMGEGDSANRSTSDALSGMIEDDVKLYQKSFADIFTHEILGEILLEAPFKVDILEIEKNAKLVFEEVNLDNKIKAENHDMLKFQGNVITHEEVRKKHGHHPVQEKEKEGLMLNMNAKAEQATNAMKAKQQPSNQHKKNAGPTKRKSSKETELINDNVDYLYHALQHITDDAQRVTIVDSFLKNMYLALDYEEKISYIDSAAKFIANIPISTPLKKFQELTISIL